MVREDEVIIFCVCKQRWYEAGRYIPDRLQFAKSKALAEENSIVTYREMYVERDKKKEKPYRISKAALLLMDLRMSLSPTLTIIFGILICGISDK